MKFKPIIGLKMELELMINSYKWLGVRMTDDFGSVSTQTPYPPTPPPPPDTYNTHKSSSHTEEKNYMLYSSSHYNILPKGTDHYKGYTPEKHALVNAITISCANRAQVRHYHLKCESGANLLSNTYLFENTHIIII